MQVFQVWTVGQDDQDGRVVDYKPELDMDQSVEPWHVAGAGHGWGPPDGAVLELDGEDLEVVALGQEPGDVELLRRVERQDGFVLKRKSSLRII